MEPLSPLPSPLVDECSKMEVDNPKVESQELFPRWFTEEENCGDSCFVCAREKHKKGSPERGTFGVVTRTSTSQQAHKLIRGRSNISCSSALRELTAYSLLGTCCEQITRWVEPPLADTQGNVTLKLEEAHSSLLAFTRCVKVRHSLPGFEHMSVHFLLWSLLKAATHLNHCQLVHRDIKPGNVLVFPGPRVTLCDFGGCRLVSSFLEPLDAEMSDTVCTKNYAPPEEAQGKHGTVFDSFSIAATVIHYAMSYAPNYKPMMRVNRRTFTKLCKPFPGLLTILRLMCRCDPGKRYTPAECLQVFEDVYPHLVQRYKGFTVLGITLSSPRLVPMSTTCRWDRFHNFKQQVWPCIVEAIRATQGSLTQFMMDRKSSLAVAFYVLNMLQNVHNDMEYEPCTELRCYIMLIPCFIRTASLMVGNADDTDDYLPICNEVFKRHRCIVLYNAHAEANFALQLLHKCGINWGFPERISTLVELQDELNL
jgi:serine/threonine protein kinase